MPTKFVARLLVMLASMQAGLAVAQTATPPVGPDYYYGPRPWHMMGAGFYGWPGWWMVPVMILMVIFAAACLVFLYRASHGPRRTAADWDDPVLPALRILNERFARGEIQREEFEEKKAALLFGGRR